MPYIYNIIDYMKKSKKIWISASAVTAVLVALAIGLGIGIPQLLNQQKIDELVQNQVKPSEGNGSYLHSEIKTAAGNANRDLTIEKVANLALASDAGYENIANNQISNYVTEFFKNFKGSDAYAQRYITWIDEINTEFSDTVKNYQNQHGANWEFYFQANVLDPAGGNEDDWKRSRIFSKTIGAFDEFVFQNYYINAKDKNGNILKSTSSPTNALLKYLYSGDLINGATVGVRNNVVFEPDATSASTTPYAKALAKLQEYVFEQYVKENLPLVTSMVLYKHVAPQADSKSNFFNVAKAKLINDATAATDVVGTEASYAWQAFDVAQSAIDNPTGATPSTTTDKFVDFVDKLNAGAFVDPTTGAINIPASLYTDDSATLYYIKTNDVFNSSYTQYAAAANYKFNTILGVTDANVPTKTSITTTKLNGKDATEIMNNFMSSADATPTGYFALPNQVQSIINNDTNFFFEGSYNGVKSIADTINLPNTSPFIMTRDEAGVHIIGIDRYSQIKAAATYDGRINEIANTILWRHILGEFGQNSNTGFSLDLKSELKTYFSTNRTKLLFNYITENEAITPVADEYIFSNNFTDITSLPKLSDSVYYPYLTAWISYSDYLEKTKHKTTVKEKILGVQSNYLTRIYGNSVVNNGIAGVLPYTRTTTANASPTLVNKGIVDDNFGTYASLNIFQDGDTTKTYSEGAAQTQLNTITNTIIPSVYNNLNTTQKIGMKNLTYQSAKYNQYFLVGTQTPIRSSTTEYINDGDLLNASISVWISQSATKNTVEIEKLVADINYTGTNSIYNTNTIALGNAYTDPTTVAATPALPTTTSTDSVKTTYVNWQLQKAYDQIKKLPSVTGSLKDLVNNGTSYADLTALARNNWAEKYLANTASGSDTYSLLKEIAALKYAFDFDEATSGYNLTKFRDYLLNQTSNYGKGAFVWQASDKINLISDYAETANGIADHFTYQPNNITKNAGAYGYAYQGADRVDTYRGVDGMWNSDVTFSNKASYYNTAQLEYATAGGTTFNGYLGMQLENSTSSELIGQVKTDLFSGTSNVYVGYDAATATTAPDTSTIDIQGVLYNYYNRAEFVKAINNQIYSWQQVNALANWLGDTFGINVANVSRTNISTARSELAAIAADNTKLPDGVFTRNKNALLVNSTISLIDPSVNKTAPYYYEESDGYYASVVFTQFNYQDVVRLFDTNNDAIVNNNDTGINWNAVTTDGFLGVGADAFFYSAFNWYTSQSSATTNAYDNILTRQGKVYVYDRRLNDQLGRTLVENYKENKTGQ